MAGVQRGGRGEVECEREARREREARSLGAWWGILKNNSRFYPYFFIFSGNLVVRRKNLELSELQELNNIKPQNMFLKC